MSLSISSPIFSYELNNPLSGTWNSSNLPLQRQLLPSLQTNKMMTFILLHSNLMRMNLLAKLQKELDAALAKIKEPELKAILKYLKDHVATFQLNMDHAREREQEEIKAQVLVSCLLGNALKPNVSPMSEGGDSTR
ncbi:hypothetical protein L2E82_08552 [Cichorium intybus]|uniref:Uncharacterized protein n=1 Tax=Cichorium intybus TaxID=13427 RepID=A0ACB9G6K0_CICIN|nr:hypothetical protein L2E82_08552 [Cichorium intybus]